MTSTPKCLGAPTFLSASEGRITRKADTNVGAPARAFWLPVILVLLAEAGAIVAFYTLEWSWLRRMHVLWLRTTLQALGCTVQTGTHSLTVNGHAFQISPDCTYVDLVICSLPLLWRVHRRFSANLAVLATFAAAVVVVNLLRVLYGVYACSHGVSLFWSHDLVDYVLWYPTMGVVALLWLRSLKTLWRAPSARERLGVRQSPGALAREQEERLAAQGGQQSKAPEDRRTPKPGGTDHAPFSEEEVVA